ncbi:MAG: hypothetical protein H6Q89_3616, partial [Myxococcaceae bacterium]|nr:hypothetical protein [Myxococcaceae bacterium]
LAVTLQTGRTSALLEVVGNHLYVLTGENNGFLNGVERAQIDGSGALGPFATMSTAASGSAPVVAIGNRVCLIKPGGVLEAVANADATLSTFVDTGNTTTARSAPAVAALGDYVHLLGGSNGSTPLGTIERAFVNTDDSLAPFAIQTPTLTTPRASARTAALASTLYVIGGLGADALSSIEQAPINPDGTLGAFGVSGVTLSVARFGHASVVIGSSLYVLGGQGDNTSGNADLLSVERSAIAADGGLGSFSPVLTLKTARHGAATAVVGSYLYVLGGMSGGTPLTSIERSPISSAGVLGSFTTLDAGLVEPRVGASSLTVGNRLYVFGGLLDGGTSYEAAPLW